MKEQNSPLPDERWQIQSRIERRLADITKFELRLYPAPPRKLVDIVATVATNTQMLKTDEEILKKAREIDAWNDPISSIYHNSHAPLIKTHEERLANKSSRTSSDNSTARSINYLKMRVQRAELKIKVAQEFYPHSRTMSDAFGSQHEENAFLLLSRLTQPEKSPFFKLKSRPIATARIKDGYL